MLDHLLSSVHLLGRRPATGVGAGRRHLRPSVIVHGAVAVVRARLSSALIAENTWQKSEDTVKQLRSSVHLLGRVPTPSSFWIGAPAVWGRRALTCGATAPSAFGVRRLQKTPGRKLGYGKATSSQRASLGPGAGPQFLRVRLGTVSEVIRRAGGGRGGEARVRA